MRVGCPSSVAFYRSDPIQNDANEVEKMCESVLTLQCDLKSTMGGQSCPSHAKYLQPLAFSRKRTVPLVIHAWMGVT
jgi:hypothetical protein